MLQVPRKQMGAPRPAPRPVRRALSRVARVQLASVCPARASLAASVCCAAGSACAPARSGTMQRQRHHAPAPCTSTAAPRSCSLTRALSISRQAVASSAPRDGLRVSPPAVSVSRRRSSRHHGAFQRCLCAHTACFVSAARAGAVENFCAICVRAAQSSDGRVRWVGRFSATSECGPSQEQ